MPLTCHQTDSFLYRSYAVLHVLLICISFQSKYSLTSNVLRVFTNIFCQKTLSRYVVPSYKYNYFGENQSKTSIQRNISDLHSWQKYCGLMASTYTQQEAMYLYKTTELQTSCQSWVWLIIPEGKPQRALLTIRGPFLFFNNDKANCPVDLLTLINISVQLQALSPTYNVSFSDIKLGTEANNSVVCIHRDNSSVLSFLPIDASAADWCSALRMRSSLILNTKDNINGQGDTSQKSAKSLDKLFERERLLVHKKSSEMRVLAEQNARLQVSAAAATRAAGEIVDQKMVEIRCVKEQLLRVLQEKEFFHTESKRMRKNADKKNTQLLAITKQLADTREKFRTLQDDLADSEKTSDNTVWKLMQKRNRVQELVIQNRQLRLVSYWNFRASLLKGGFREEAQTGSEYFLKLQNKFQERMQMIKELIEASDAFDLLRRKVALALAIIFALRHAKHLNDLQSDQLRKGILEIQRDVRVREAAVKTQYIKYRSILLNHQIESVSGSVKHQEFFEFIKTILNRYGWILHEGQVGHTVGKSAHSSLPLWDSTVEGNGELYVPFLDQFYQNWGTEYCEADLMIPPDKLFSE